MFDLRADESTEAARASTFFVSLVVISWCSVEFEATCLRPEIILKIDNAKPSELVLLQAEDLNVRKERAVIATSAIKG